MYSVKGTTSSGDGGGEFEKSLPASSPLSLLPLRLVPPLPDPADARPGELSALRIRPTLIAVTLTALTAELMALTVELNLALHLGAIWLGFTRSGLSARRTRWGSEVTEILSVELDLALQLGAVVFGYTLRESLARRTWSLG
jgi:hypothetical protein